MEESKPHAKRRSGGAAGRPAVGGIKAASSAHIIDLRQQGSGVSAPTRPATPAPAARPSRRPKPPTRPLGAPTTAAKPPSKPIMATPAPAASTIQSAAPSLPPRRFWPAFWRFLLLLVILGLLIAGGLYLYINYYRG